MTQSIAFGIAGSAVTGDVGQKHVVLIYRAGNSKIMVLHLGWHRKLYHHEWCGEYHWLEFSGLEPELQETFADWAVIVAGAARDKPIPYSVVFDPGQNFELDGKFVDKKDGSGLTCATFLLALFNDFNLPLIDITDWPISRRGDFAWIRKVLGKLRGVVGNWDWLEQVRRRHELKRFRPEEVFVTAGLFAGTALTFSDVEPNGRLVLKQVPA